MKPLVSILVLNYNHKEFLKPMFDSVRKLNKKCRYEVFLVDNASSDGSVDYMKRNYPEIKIVQTGSNMGTPGFNRALSKVKGDYVVWLGIDSKFHKDALVNMVDIFKKEKDIGAVYPKEADFSGRTNDVDIAFSHILYFFTSSKNKRQREMFGVGPGMIRTRLLKQVQYLYDPLYFYGYEDVDLALRLRLMGYRVVLGEKSVFYHRGSISFKKYFGTAFKVYLGDRNSFITYFKIFQWRNILLYLPYNITFRLLLIAADLTRFRFSHAIARVKAILWLPFNFGTVLRKRAHTQKLRKKSDAKAFGSIISERYFIGVLLSNLSKRESFDIYEFSHKRKTKLKL